VVAETHQEALGTVDAQSVNQLFAQQTHYTGMDHQHALFIQPDLAFVAFKADL
jgi:hypothetical protein